MSWKKEPATLKQYKALKKMFHALRYNSDVPSDLSKGDASYLIQKLSEKIKETIEFNAHCYAVSRSQGAYCSADSYERMADYL